LSDTNLHKIWHTLQQVPKGKVVSYGQLADLAGLPGRARLAGRALRVAPKSLDLPWHRVLRASGQLAFKPGSSQATRQRELLLSEGILVRNNRVDLSQHRWQPELAELLAKLKY